MSNYFFDASAIIDIINSEVLQEKFVEQKIITNTLHIAEVYYYLLKNYNKQTADYWMQSLNFGIIEITIDLSLKGALFRFEHKNQRFSYADSIGYVSSMESNLIFLTGDKDFIGFENVEITN